MDLEVELKNYRCFPLSRPARFVVADGFRAFVGLNNAGKSTLLKFFYEFRPIFSELSVGAHNWENPLRGGRMPFTPLGTADRTEIFNNQNTHDLEVVLRMRDAEERATRGTPVPPELRIRVDRLSISAAVEIPDTRPVRTSFGSNDEVLVIDGTPAWDLRPWLEVFRDLAAAPYIPAFRNAINAGSAQHYDLQIGSTFIQEWDRFKSGPTKADNEAALELTREIQRIFGFERLDINASQNNDTLQVIIEDKSYRLDEVGGGLAHFVIVLAYVATRKPAFVLVDEPEINLHPSLQLDFLTTIATFASQGVLFATHSLGLARAASDAIYTVRRLGPGDVQLSELENTPRLSEFVGELSLSGYQELGFDKVLLVEGVSDVKLFQRLLRLQGIEHEVVIVPLGGGALMRPSAEDELLELTRITQNIFAIVDSERDVEDGPLQDDRAGFEAMCGRLGITAHVLGRRSIENYFTDRAIKRALGQSYNALQPFERLADSENGWSKRENWRIASELLSEELQGTDLGEFLELLART